MISVESTARFRACLRRQSLNREEVFRAMQRTAAAWGRPHLHGSAGVRRLRSGLCECRCGLAVRLLFRPEPDRLVFDFAGNHDEVRAYLKNLG